MSSVGKQFAVIGLVMTVLLGSAPSGQTAVPPAGPPPLSLSMTSLVPEATIEATADGLAVGVDAVWVLNRAAGTVTRVDPKTHTVGTPLAMGEGSEPCHATLPAFKSLWVPLCGRPGLARIDEAAAKPPVVIATGISSAGPVATGTGSIWMITAPGTLSRLDPDTNAVVAEVSVPSGASGLAFDHDAVWVSSATSHVVTRVHGYTNVVTETIKVGPAPSSVAAGAGAVWTLNGGDGTVSRIDPKANKVTATIKTGAAGPGTILVGEGSVWVSVPGTPLIRIDPEANLVRQQFTGPGGGVLAIGFKSLWLAATTTAVWRLDPRRVEATRK